MYMKQASLCICSLASLALSAGLHAQTCTFESQDYKSIGVYDGWAKSPSRTNVLSGNVAVVPNSLKDEANSSDNILAFQRSRYGNNTFEAKINLAVPFELTTSTKYVHVFVNKPKEGRVMLIGLGKRDDRGDQSDQTEQFWEFSTTTIGTNQWEDAVFAVKGNGGITISSLVVVVDAESTHNLAEDFLCYIDDIEVSANAAPRFVRGDYPLNFDAESVSGKSANYLSSITLSGTQSPAQSIAVGSVSPQLVYRPLLEQSFKAMPGETLTPRFNFSANWMNGYVYIDYDRDGTFADDLNEDYTIPEGSDLATYSYVEVVENTSGYNSLGEAVTGNARNVLNPPAFTLPADLPYGIYRMRYKVDWGDVDAGGRATSTNSIISNGGQIVDVCLNIHGEESRVTVQNRNGEVLSGDSAVISGTMVKFGEPLELLMVPAPGFRQNGITLRHGYLDGDSLIHSTPQYKDLIIPAYAFKDNRYTIPAKLVDGDLMIIAEFTESNETVGGEDYPLNFDKENLTIKQDNGNRYLRTLRFVGNEGSSFSTSLPTTAPINVYQDKTSLRGKAKTGETLTPTINYRTTGQMHGYLYIDYDNDGRFNVALDADHKPLPGGELVSYSYLNGFNSTGEALESAEETNYAITLPPFTVPADLPTGVYRARLKIDWNNADPGGQFGTGENDIDVNGGEIVDFLLTVFDGTQSLKLDTRNGNIYGASQTALPYLVTIGNALTLFPQAVADGYELTDAVYVRSGFNMDGPQYVHGNQQWYADTIPAASLTTSGIRTSVWGDMEVKAYFAPTDLPEYDLVFSDEFDAPNGTQPDETKWSRCKRQSSTWNRFLSDTVDVVYQEDGNLVLKAIPNLDRSKDNVAMLSGGIETNGKFSFMHGKVECRAKVNGHTGNFPAIWMMPQNQTGGWPTCGEIDIFEQIDTENKAYHTIHSHWTYDLGNKGNPQSSFNETVDMTRYHTYGLEWDSQELRWLVDGVQKASYARVPQNEAQGQWPFEKAFYLILNQSVGNGSWAAPADESHTYRMDVDWIRVYQKNERYVDIKEVQACPLSISVKPGLLTVSCEMPRAVVLYDVSGRLVFREQISGNRSIPLQKGIYLIDNRKIMIP